MNGIFVSIRFGYKCMAFRFETWIEMNALKFVLLTLRQWGIWWAKFAFDYAVLVQEFRRIEKKFYSLSDLLDQDGLCPTLRVDYEEREQYMMDYLLSQRLEVYKSPHFGHYQVRNFYISYIHH